MVDAAAFPEHPHPEELHDLPEPEELPDRAADQTEELPDELVSALAKPMRGPQLPPVPAPAAEPPPVSESDSPAESPPELPPLSPEAARLARELLTPDDRPDEHDDQSEHPAARSPLDRGAQVTLTVPEAAPAAATSAPDTDPERSAPVILTLPPDFAADRPDRGLAWTDLWQQLMHRLYGGERGWLPDAPVTLRVSSRAIEPRQLTAIADALQEVQLQLTTIDTDSPDTATIAMQAGYRLTFTPSDRPAPDDGEPAPEQQPDCLYLDKTLRSGVEIRYPGTVVIRGDANPGSAIVAGGDILVWGRLCGVAHAGVNGDTEAIIMALNLDTNQVRIATRTARVPESKLDVPCPEVAYISGKGIRISPAADFAKNEVRSRLGDPPA